MPTDDLPPAAAAFLDKWPRPENRRAMERDLAALLEAVRAEAAPRWVRTAEGLPAEGVEVLVRDANFRKRLLAVYSAELGIWATVPDRYTLVAVTHWQPLPPKPRPEPDLRAAGDTRPDHIRRECYPCPRCDGTGIYNPAGGTTDPWCWHCDGRGWVER